MRRVMLGSLLVCLVAFALFVLYSPSEQDPSAETPSDEVVAERIREELREVATPDYVQAQIARTLDEDRPEEAEGYIALAAELGQAVPAGLLARYEEATSTTAAVWRTTTRGAWGFLTGEAEDGASLAGSAISDLTLYGDARDVTFQTRNYLTGAEVDEFVLGLSVVGLGMSAATVATAGTAAPAKVGLSMVKAAKRAGRLTAGLETALRRTVAETVDMPALRRQLGALDWRSPGKSIEGVKSYAAGLDTARLRGMFGQLGSVVDKTSAGGAMRILRHVDSADDLVKAERVAARFGKASPAVFETLGKRVFKAFAKVAKMAIEALWALITAILSALSFVISTLWTVVKLLRRLFARLRAGRRPVAQSAGT
ncbi:hypothetical protein [Azospirillum sp. SYSU D00513]|uniref:hypothetical protein n=1 Tax=Azospirillum sp. SYSU D00513 TaxID=2812561 RepID=UPI001A96C78B|nr:hypothetical protein [Azospirillum sp. SYSU D00513]